MNPLISNTDSPEIGRHRFDDILVSLGLDPKVRTDLHRYSHCRAFPRKTALLRAGEHWTRLWYLDRGLIRLCYTDAGGREFNKAFFAEGSCIWPVAPRDRQQPVRFSIFALEDTRVIEYPFQPLHDLLNQVGCWARFALPFAEALVEQKFRREHDFLLLSVAERYRQFIRERPELIGRIPDYHLASFMGVTNVTLSRIKQAVDFNKR